VKTFTCTDSTSRLKPLLHELVPTLHGRNGVRKLAGMDTRIRRAAIARLDAVAPLFDPCHRFHGPPVGRRQAPWMARRTCSQRVALPLAEC
jgi:hypothetical protein